MLPERTPKSWLSLLCFRFREGNEPVTLQRWDGIIRIFCGSGVGTKSLYSSRGVASKGMFFDVF